MINPKLKEDIDRYIKEHYRPSSEWPNRWWEPGAEDEPGELPQDQWLDVEPEDLPFR